MEDAEKVMRYPAKQTAVKHERIVKEASRLFRERGFEKVSVDEVMKAAGLTHGAFYAHFSSKEELKSAADRKETHISGSGDDRITECRMKFLRAFEKSSADRAVANPNVGRRSCDLEANHVRGWSANLP